MYGVLYRIDAGVTDTELKSLQHMYPAYAGNYPEPKRMNYAAGNMPVRNTG